MSNRPSEVFVKAKSDNDLSSVASLYTALSRHGNGPCPLCGGVDRFYIKRGDQYWACRKCGNHGDVIDLVALCEGVTKLEAAKRLLGDWMPGGAKSPTHRPPQRSDKSRSGQSVPRSLLPPGILETILRASARLVDSHDARDYLNCRGISFAVAASYLVGFDPEKYDPRYHERRPAITFPIHDEAKNIVGLKYRFFDARALENKSSRFTQVQGSTPGLFGGHLLPDRGEGRHLIAVEGEFNALSLAQSLTDLPIDVVSIGSDSGGRSIHALNNVFATRGFSSVLLWLDEGERAITFGHDLGNPILMRSPEGMDANDILLQHGPVGLRRVALARLGGRTPNPVKTLKEGSECGATRLIRLPRDLANKKLVSWNRRAAEVHAWALWVKKYARATDAPDLQTTGECVQHVLEIWRAEGATIPDE